ncbi:MAG: beta-Ala-His dipeptidase [Planctomycetota bacterium]
MSDSPAALSPDLPKPLEAALDDLKPAQVWRFFHGLTQVPRPSRHEEKIRRHVHEVAGQQGWTSREDDAGNIVIDVPATKGYEQVPVTIIQGHLDMVAEANRGTTHDFENDPIKAMLAPDPAHQGASSNNGGPKAVVIADGTTLGADNGIGVAMGMAAAADPDCVHGPLELLLTSDEEMGMTGANALKPDFVRGRRLINLDSEEDDAIYIGCAGGCDVTLNWPFTGETIIESSDAKEICRVTVRGLRGGHSGGDIHLNHANAIRLIARLLGRVLDEGQDDINAQFSPDLPEMALRLITLEGGKQRNAIPREASAMVSGPAGTEAALGLAADAIIEEAKSLHGEPATEVDVELIEFASLTDAAALSIEDSTRIIRTLSAIPSGVLSLVPDIPGLVQTSNNLSTITTDTPDEDAEDSSANIHRSITVGCLTRSSNWSELKAAVRTLIELGRLGGAQVHTSNAYPGWPPNADSDLLERSRAQYEALFGEAPGVTAIHAGLECGIIGKRLGGEVDMVSFGPNIRGAHSPDERVYVDSVAKSYELLKAVLRDLAEAK